MKTKFAVALVASGLFCQQARAADAHLASACDVAGLINAGSTAGQTTYPNALPGADSSSSNLRLNTTVAADYGCGLFNLQGIASLTYTLPWQYSYGDRGYTYNDIYGSGEIDVFARDPDQYAAGLGLQRFSEDKNSAGFGAWSNRLFDTTWNDWDAIAFAEFYPSEQFTLGLTGSYGFGDQVWGLNGNDYQWNNVSGSAYVRYYMTPDMRLGLRGNLSQQTNVTSNVAYSNVNGQASAEYKLADSPVSFRGVVTYGQNSFTAADPLYPNSYLLGYLGVSVALGAHAKGSLLEQDRNGVVLH